jgi:hypothetical protein
VVTPRSRRTCSTGVPTNADMPSLSNTGSPSTGASSPATWVCGASGGKAAVTAAASRTRCHAMAVRSAVTPMWVGGSDTWRT